MSLQALVACALFDAGIPPQELLWESPRTPAFGDLATHFAFQEARRTGQSSMDIAAAIAARLEGTSVASPGFINWRVPDHLLQSLPVTMAEHDGPVMPKKVPLATSNAQEARGLLLGTAVASVSFTRAGVPARETWTELLDRQDHDCLRLWLLSRPAMIPLVLELEVLETENVTNIGFYPRYSEARAYSILRKANLEGLNPNFEIQPLARAERELALVLLLLEQELLQAPHRRLVYALRLSEAFHRYYGTRRVFGSDRAEYHLGWIKAAALGLSRILSAGLGVTELIF